LKRPGSINGVSRCESPNPAPQPSRLKKDDAKESRKICNYFFLKNIISSPPGGPRENTARHSTPQHGRPTQRANNTAHKEANKPEPPESIHGSWEKAQTKPRSRILTSNSKAAPFVRALPASLGTFQTRHEPVPAPDQPKPPKLLFRHRLSLEKKKHGPSHPQDVKYRPHRTGSQSPRRAVRKKLPSKNSFLGG